VDLSSSSSDFGRASTAVWRVQLLGGLRAARDEHVLAQFPSRAVAMLLARLALYPRRSHPREELIELLWPGVEPAVGRNRLRQVLSTLRRLLEPPGTSPVLVADRKSIGALPGSVASDVYDFERLLRDGNGAQALGCYRGDLLPGYDDEWVEDERLRLRSLLDTAQSRYAVAAAQPLAGDTAPALTAMQASRAAPVRNLPAFVSVFFGREAEQRHLHDALSVHRLVTLSGFGGCGKTRLAVEVARAAVGVDHVAFIALADCDDPTQIADCIRAALRIQPSPEDALEQLVAFLVDRDVLLVLDNFEQLAEHGGADVVLELLAQLPRLRCLVTSRRVLDVAGEREIALGTLPLPDTAMPLAEAAATPSLALFIDRARGARPDFALTPRNAAALIGLTRALEGLPVAIEIAASRIRAYSPAEMHAALGRRFELLTRRGARARREGRHASLQATVDWSWRLLAPRQQRFLAALSIFRGDWDAAAVESVCETPDAQRELEALVADSMLTVGVDTRGHTRFSMLETIREFAQERLGGDAPALRARHRAHYLSAAQQAGPDGAVPEAEFANMRHALQTALDDHAPGTALALGVALQSHWEAHGMPRTMLDLLQLARQQATEHDDDWHAGMNLLATMLLNAGYTDEGRACAAQVLAEARTDPARRAAALVSVAHLAWARERRGDEIKPMLEEALALAAHAKRPQTQADATRALAIVVHVADRDAARAEALCARAGALYRAAGRMRAAYRMQLLRAPQLCDLGRLEEARRAIEDCEAYFRALDSTADLMCVANLSGILAAEQERWPDAAAAYRQCLRLAWVEHSRYWLGMAFWNLPRSLGRIGHVTVAARLMSFGARFWARNFGALDPNDVAFVAEVHRRIAERLGVATTDALWSAGEALSLPDAVELALSSPGV
jgi:predicted ATPase